MLTDSKIRQVGFIRTSSSKKLLPPNDFQQKRRSSDDSFSSFQYQKNIKSPFKDNQNKRSHGLLTNNQRINKSRQYIHQQNQQIIKKPLTPQIPKPIKKVQPSFQNEKLKNNFFQQKYQTRQKLSINQIKKQLPRMNTPNFQQNKFKKQIESVQNICSQIGNIKLQGNFSFNPKMHQKIKKQNSNNILKSSDEDHRHDRQLKQVKNKNIKNKSDNKLIINKPNENSHGLKQNNYFLEQPKFKYDFQQSSSGSDLQGQQQFENYQQKQSQRPQLNYKRSGSQSQEQNSYFQKQQQRIQELQSSSSQISQNQAIQYYKQQKRQNLRVEQSKNQNNRLSDQKIKGSYGMINIKHKKRVENQQSNEQDQYTGGYNRKNTKDVNSSSGIQRIAQSHSNFKPLTKPMPKKPEPQQPLITDYAKTQFKGKMILQKPFKQNPKQRSVIQHISKQLAENNSYFNQNIASRTISNKNNNQNYQDKKIKNVLKSQQQQNQGQYMFQTNGGICFDVDVKQFSQAKRDQQGQIRAGNNSNIGPGKRAYNQAAQQRKKKNPNAEKQQLLKRRQMAKIYSKQARFRLFGFS